MEVVRLEFVGAVALSSAAVVQFVRALRDVPQGAVCEIEEIRCRRLREARRSAEASTESVVRLHCDPPVAAFLCKRFAQQTRHIARGELLLVRCRRIHEGNASARLASLRMPLTGADQTDSKMRAPLVTKPMRQQSCHDLPDRRQPDSLFLCGQPRSAGASSQSALPPSALPMDKVIALIDVLGDQVADAHDAYELYALRDAPPPLRLSLLGLSKAMTRLCEKEWVVKQSKAALSGDPRRQPRQHQQQQYDGDDGTPPFATVSSLRILLAKLVASSGVAMTSLPTVVTAPCLSYTDFLACYVALLHSIHSSATCA